MLFKYCNEYPGSKDEDRDFLNFLSKFRNTIHANFVYFGKDYEYFFENEAHFIFENSKQVIWTNPYNDDGSILMIYILDKLKKIWKKLINGISFDKLIEFYEADDFSVRIAAGTWLQT